MYFFIYSEIMKRIIRTLIIAIFISQGWNSASAQQKPGNDCDKHSNPQTISPAKIEFGSANIFKRLVISISNPANAAITVGKITIDEKNKNQFALQYQDIVIVEPGVAQPKETCNNSRVAAPGSCSFRIRQLSAAPFNLSAILRIPINKCDLIIPVKESDK